MRFGTFLSLVCLFNENPGDAPTGAGASPPATVTPAAPQITLPPAGTPPAGTPPAPPEKDPDWLNKRIGNAKKSAVAETLKELGVEDLESAKAAIAAKKKIDDEAKTAAQKAAELDTKLKATETEKAAMAEALATYAAAQMKGLTEAQRAAVTAIAGEDAAKQLKAIEALSPTWAAGATSTTTTDTTTQKPTDTAPIKSAPKDNGGNSPPDHKAVYAELKKTNPFLAARYGIAHGVHDQTT